MKNPVSAEMTKDKNLQPVQLRKDRMAKAGTTVAAGVAGAAAGAALGLALSNKKTRDRLVKLATEARDALENFMEDLRSAATDMDLEDLKDQAEANVRKVKRIATRAATRATGATKAVSATKRNRRRSKS